jgi:hypothetical protein
VHNIDPGLRVTANTDLPSRFGRDPSLVIRAGTVGIVIDTDDDRDLLLVCFRGWIITPVRLDEVTPLIHDC